MSKAEEKKLNDERAEFCDGLAATEDWPKGLAAVVLLNPTLAKKTGRPIATPITASVVNLSTDRINDDGYPEFMGVGRVGKGGQLEDIGDTRLSLSMAFPRATKKSDKKTAVESVLSEI